MTKENDDWRKDYKAPPGRYLKMFEGWESNSDIFDSEMVYSCAGRDFDAGWKCDKVTGLRLKVKDTPGASCCSEFCKQLILRNNHDTD